MPDRSVDIASAGEAAFADASAAPPPSADETLYVHEVSKRFGATQALDRVSLLLRAGEVHGLVGAEGTIRCPALRSGPRRAALGAVFGSRRMGGAQFVAGQSGQRGEHGNFRAFGGVRSFAGRRRECHWPAS